MRHDFVDKFEGLQLEFGGPAKRDFQAMDAHVAERFDGAEAAVLVNRLCQLLIQSAAIRPVIVKTGRWRHWLRHMFAEFIEQGTLFEGSVRIIDDGLDDVLPVVGEAPCDERLPEGDVAAEIPPRTAMDGMAVFIVEVATVANDHDFKFDFDILQIVNHELCLAESHFTGDDDAADVELLAEEADGFGRKAADACAEMDRLVDAPRLEAEHDGGICHDVSVRIELFHGFNGGAKIGEALGAVVMGVDGEIKPPAVVMDGVCNFPQVSDLQEVIGMTKRSAVWAHLPAVFGEPVARNESREELLCAVFYVLLDLVGRVSRV